MVDLTCHSEPSLRSDAGLNSRLASQRTDRISPDSVLCQRCRKAREKIVEVRNRRRPYGVATTVGCVCYVQAVGAYASGQLDGKRYLLWRANQSLSEDGEGIDHCPEAGLRFTGLQCDGLIGEVAYDLPSGGRIGDSLDRGVSRDAVCSRSWRMGERPWTGRWSRSIRKPGQRRQLGGRTSRWSACRRDNREKGEVARIRAIQSSQGEWKKSERPPTKIRGRPFQVQAIGL